MILLKQHGPHSRPLAARGLRCGVTASGGDGGGWGDTGDGALPGVMSPVGAGGDKGHNPVPKAESSPRAELPNQCKHRSRVELG